MNFSNTFARLKEIIDEIFNKEFQIKYPNLYELTINNNIRVNYYLNNN